MKASINEMVIIIEVIIIMLRIIYLVNLREKFSRGPGF